MKKFILLLLIGLLFASCEGLDEFACKTNVMKEFPGAIEIKNVPNKHFSFFVLDKDSSVWYVQNMSISDPKVTGKELIFKHK